MALTAGTYLGIASLAATAVGLGMQYKAQTQAARQQSAMAEYNYAIEAQAARQNAALMQWQANAQAKNANANAAMASQSAAANAAMLQNRAAQNAALIRQQSEAQASQLDTASRANVTRGVEDVRRTREDQMRMAAIQRARQAKSGVASTGTPVEVLAESARNMQLAINDSWYETTVESSRLDNEAAVERWKGERSANMELFGADQAASMELFGGAIEAANFANQAGMARAEGALAPIRARQDLRRADLNRLAGLNGAAGMRSAATAGLVSGSGTLLSQGMQVYDSMGGFQKNKLNPYGNYGSLTGYGKSIGTRPAFL